MPLGIMGSIEVNVVLLWCIESHVVLGRCKWLDVSASIPLLSDQTACLSYAANLHCPRLSHAYRMMHQLCVCDSTGSLVVFMYKHESVLSDHTPVNKLSKGCFNRTRWQGLDDEKPCLDDINTCDMLPTPTLSTFTLPSQVAKDR